MAQTGYTPISLYYSATAAAVPTNSNLANGELAINITDGKLYYKDNTGTVKLLTSTGSEISPITNNGVVYINSSGQATSGSALTFDGTNLSNSGNYVSSAATGRFVKSDTTGRSIFTGGTTGGITNGAYIITEGYDYGGTAAGGAINLVTAGASSPISFFINGTEGMRLTSTGLGIGTNLPATRLQIGDATVSTANKITFGKTTATTEATLPTVYAGSLLVPAASVDLVLEAGSSSGGIAIRTAGSTRAVVDSSGSVGIGTSSPLGKLDVRGTAYFNGTGATGGASQLMAAFGASGGSNFGQLINTNTTWSLGYGASYSSVGTSVLTWDASGNVGIGRTPVAYSSFKVLDVAGSAGAIQKWVHTGSTVELQAYASSGLTGIGSATNHSLILVTNDTERLRIGTSGQLGIGGANYGTAGQVLTSNGSGAAPSWQAGGGGGGSAATSTSLGTVYGSQTTGGGTPYLTAYGYNAGTGATGTYCTYIGRNVGDNSPTGARNVIVGVNAFEGTGTGNYNVGVGFGVFAGTSSGANNVAVGTNALNGVSTGSSNVGIGFNALGTSLTTGSYNVAVGEYALNSTNGDSNVAFGYRAGFSNTTGSANVAIGHQALYNNTTGGTNIGIGYAAGYGLRTNTLTPGQNIAIGNEALYSSSHASYNIAIGYQALRAAGDAGGASVAIGQQAGRVCATPASSIFIGNAAAYTATYWIGGTCVGTNAGFSYNDPGTPYPGNTFVGDGAGYKVSTGTGNTFLGGGGSGYSNGPGYNTTTGYQNTGMGTGALAANVTGGNSTGIGYVAFSNQTGGENTGLGSYAGVYNFGSGAATVGGNRNVFLGAYTIASGASDSNCIIIGAATVGKGSNTGFINPNSGGVYQGNNSSSWSTTSDQRLKKNIVDNTVGLSAINSIRVRNFEYRLEDEITELSKDCAIKKEGVQLGVIAQELQAVLPDCVKQETTGVLSVDPDNLTWYMVNAIKELNAKIEAQAAEIAILKGQA